MPAGLRVTRAGGVEAAAAGVFAFFFTGPGPFSKLDTYSNASDTRILVSPDLDPLGCPRRLQPGGSGSGSGHGSRWWWRRSERQRLEISPLLCPLHMYLEYVDTGSPG